MSNFSPFPFQNIAIDKLITGVIKLWQQEGNQNHIVFKSPTGSGKTFMVANFIHGLNKLPNWDLDRAYIWITFNDNLAMQSRDKFQEYFNTTLENNLLTVDDFKNGKLLKNDILFINWQKLVSTAAENRVIRRPTDIYLHKEQGFYFEDVIEATKKEGREIIMIIDESHTHLSPLAQEKVVNVVDPKIILNVSATPKNIPTVEEIEEGLKVYVSVKRENVVIEGLIKEKIAVQTEEDLKHFQGHDLDEALIDLGLNKRKELKSEFEQLGKKVNPLLLIQLPNDDSKQKDIGQKSKEEVVLDYLKQLGIDVDNNVALWFDGKQKNLETVTYNESDVDIMLFKQAAGTGWDCPRAHVLIMFREIQSSTFYIQTVGRILRMAEPYNKEDYKNSPQLRTGYLFTNYRRNEVAESWEKTTLNKPELFFSEKRTNISNIDGVTSDSVSRIDFGDLADAVKFQKSFLKSMDSYFGIGENEFVDQTRVKIEKKKVELKPKLTNKLIVDAVFEDFDKLNLELTKKGHDEEFEMSRNDVEKLFNYSCFKVLLEQTESDAKITNVSRSWSPLKSALRVWFKRSLDNNSDYYYRVFINDLNKDQSSIFRPAITKSLKEYRPILKEIIAKRKVQIEEREASTFKIQDRYSYTDEFDVLKPEESTSILSVVQPFYLKKQYKGRDNELTFIKYLEQKANKIEWWFKNGDSGKEYFCLKYYNTAKQEDALFYPDWIIKMKDGRIGIFDTKSGQTATHSEGRAEGLYKKLQSMNENNNIFIGGIVVLENNQWYFNSSETYEYIPGKLTSDWVPLENFLKE